MADGTVECADHGYGTPAFVCRHLVEGLGLGFVEAQADPDPGDPLDAAPSAWCNACEQVRLAAGGWNEESEKAAGVTLVCSQCFQRIRDRNS